MLNKSNSLNQIDLLISEKKFPWFFSLGVSSKVKAEDVAHVFVLGAFHTVDSLTSTGYFFAEAPFAKQLSKLCLDEAYTSELVEQVTAQPDTLQDTLVPVPKIPPIEAPDQKRSQFFLS